MVDLCTVGIDLGTTYSMVSQTDSLGIPTLVPDAESSKSLQTPSVVSIRSNGALVGQPAEDYVLSNPDEPVARFAKLKLGSQEPALIDLYGREWKSDAVSGLILRKLCHDVHAATQKKVERAVITVPAQFNHIQRSETVNAATLYAGIDSVEIVDEPVAASTYYGFAHSEKEETLLVYDLGGGTFDATLLQTSPDGLYVLGTDGLRDLGGKNFDENISDLVYSIYSRGPETRLTRNQVRAQFAKEAELIKLEFCSGHLDRINKAVMLGGQPVLVGLTRSQFFLFSKPLIDRSLACCERCLTSVGLDWSDVDRVLLTGGGSLLPSIVGAVRESSGLPADQVVTRQPHQAVAYGASLVGALAGKEGGFKLLQQITNYEIGFLVWDFEASDHQFLPLVGKNEPLPFIVKKIFYTTRADQERIVFELAQRKSAEEEPVHLGHFIFGPIRSPKKNYPIEIVLACTTSGMVEIEAVDRETNEKIRRVVDGEGVMKSGQEVRDIQTIKEMRVNDFL